MKKLNKRNIITYLMSFGVPAILFVGVLLCVGNYPFGDKNFSTWDMNLQYVDFFSWLKRVFDGEASIFYSFGKSLGDNTAGLVAYYLSSPFNLLLIFFDDIQLFIVVLATVKIASCGLTCSIFLRKRFENIHSSWIIILSVSYALMSYNLKQISNIMWLDGAIFLPLILLGVYKLVKTGNRTFLYVSVAVAILSCWYTAYMCCLFSAIYFVYEKLSEENFSIKNGIKRFFLSLLHYGITMILSVCSVMFFFLPMALQLLQGKGAATSEGFAAEFRCSLKEILSAMIPANAVTGNSDILILFCGTFTVVGIILFCLCKKIKLRDKLLGIILLCLLILSAVFIPTENIWNGFRKVASYYCRFAFIICFFMITLAATYFNVRNNIKHVKIIALICGVLVAAELVYNGQIYLKAYSVESTSAYQKYVEETENQMDALEKNDDSAFYRVEQSQSRGLRKGNILGTYNEGMAYGFSPLASYSSTYNGSIMNLYVKCGYSECNRLIMYHEPILISDSLLGIKYVLSNTAPYGYAKVETGQTYNGKSIYENPYALGLGYQVEGKIYKEISSKNSFDYQNQLLSRMLGRKVECFKEVKAELVESDGDMTWKMNSPTCENVLYGYLTRRGANSVDLYVNDEHRTYYSQWNSYKTVQISDDSNGEEQTVSMRGSIVLKEGVYGVFYYLDMEEFRQVIEELKEREFQPSVFEDGKVEGEYEAEEDGKLLLTVPYDKGWKVTCNGKKVKAKAAQGVFMVIPVEEGSNHITMRYVTPGLKKGSAVSVVAVVLFVGWELLERGRKKNRRLEENEA